jgi:hypothetical protein
MLTSPRKRTTMNPVLKDQKARLLRSHARSISLKHNESQCNISFAYFQKASKLS